MTQQTEEVQEVTTVTTPTSGHITRQVKVTTPTVETQSPKQAYETKKVIFRSYQVIWYIVGVVEVLLTFRVMLKLLGASTYSGFTNFVYSASDPFASPFFGILGTSVSQNMMLEWSTLIGMLVYVIVGYGIVAFLQFIKPTNPKEVEQIVDNQ